ncbi:MAG: GIY-YIG nuclease family protein, partial [Nocardioides sp.]|uniref:GIY-YIG nuclease family protein n=1 Tax=Nocardioides sp. TaxID=35761 RepID=UPI003D6B3254
SRPHEESPLVVSTGSTTKESATETVGAHAHDEHMAYTYMLLCADRTLYVGSTTDLERRMTEHRVGLGSEYTRHRLPVQLIWYEQYDNVAHAFAREKQIQNWGRAKRIALVQGRLGKLPALANTSATPHE